MLDVVMYHYVRNNEDYDYDCYSRRKCEFEAQVELFNKNSEIIDPNDLEKVEYFISNNKERAFLLTFDDGYKDHLYCAQYLKSINIKGIFFPCICGVEGELLDVNAIHILIGQRNIDNESILHAICKECKRDSISFKVNGKLVDIEKYLKEFINDDAFDSTTNQIIKKILQRDIVDIEKRKNILKKIFDEFTGKNYHEEALNLYLNKNEMIEMKNLGMSFGSHGFNHLWLGHINENQQFSEIKRSFDYLKKNNLIQKNETHFMCYPFGSFNNQTKNILKDLDIDFAFTTQHGTVEKGKTSKFELERWDTNHYWNNEFRKPIIRD